MKTIEVYILAIALNILIGIVVPELNLIIIEQTIRSWVLSFIIFIPCYYLERCCKKFLNMEGFVSSLSSSERIKP